MNTISPGIPVVDPLIPERPGDTADVWLFARDYSWWNPPLMTQAYHFWRSNRGEVSKIFLYSSAVLKFLLSYSGIKVVV
ncbi:hypothetical protein LBU01_20740 [Lentilactobacillus buchneri]|nr:hypothetical protein LBU01_20740 [Lentilactobacillus buchneri]